MGSICLWQEAQVGLVRCCSIRWRSVPVAVAGSSDTFTSTGGGGTVRHKSWFMIHLPRSTGDVRFWCDVTVKNPPCDRMPPRAGLPAKVTLTGVAEPTAGKP
jgi:hypothetical protein